MDKVTESLLALGCCEAAARRIGKRISGTRGCNLCFGQTGPFVLVTAKDEPEWAVLNCKKCADYFMEKHHEDWEVL